MKSLLFSEKNHCPNFSNMFEIQDITKTCVPQVGRRSAEGDGCVAGGHGSAGDAAEGAGGGGKEQGGDCADHGQGGAEKQDFSGIYKKLVLIP